MRPIVLFVLASLIAAAQSDEQAAKLRELIAGSPQSRLAHQAIAIVPPSPGWTTD
jgi:hypothetical protein